MMDYHERLTTNTLKWLESRTLSGSIFHYSGSNATSSILASMSLRSYDIWTMSDLKEFHHGIDLFFKLARQRGLGPYVDTVESFIQKELKSPVLRYFVSSFTNSHLKQRHWSCYAQGYTGACLKFPDKDLMLKGKGSLDMLMGADVIYCHSSQRRLHNRLLDHYVANIKRISKGFPLSQHGLYMARLNLGLYQALIVYALIFKTTKYRWEDEYRLISMVSNTALIQKDVARNRDFVELDFSVHTELHPGKKCSLNFSNCSLKIFA